MRTLPTAFFGHPGPDRAHGISRETAGRFEESGPRPRLEAACVETGKRITLAASQHQVKARTYSLLTPNRWASHSGHSYFLDDSWSVDHCTDEMRLDQSR